LPKIECRSERSEESAVVSELPDGPNFLIDDNSGLGLPLFVVVLLGLWHIYPFFLFAQNLDNKLPKPNRNIQQEACKYELLDFQHSLLLDCPAMQLQ
jgi:hypothetical protein